MLSKGIVKMSSHEQDEFISPIFLTPKSDGSFRLILNLKKLNESTPHIHFKIDTVESVLLLVTKDCFMAKIDIKDAYYSVKIHSDYQKYLKFIIDGKLLQFTCLPNGLSSGPRKFTKLLKPALSTLRLQHIIASSYFDDLITLASSFNKCFGNVKKTVELLDSLGFVVHPTKSVFYPCQQIEYLGFLIDSCNMTVRLTTAKKEKILNYCNFILTNNITIRQVAKLLGLFSSSFTGVRFGKLH